jgi:hypothetical protein
MCECIIQLYIRDWYYVSSVMYHSSEHWSLMGCYTIQMNKELLTFRESILSQSAVLESPSHGS